MPPIGLHKDRICITHVCMDMLLKQTQLDNPSRKPTFRNIARLRAIKMTGLLSDEHSLLTTLPRHAQLMLTMGKSAVGAISALSLLHKLLTKASPPMR